MNHLDLTEGSILKKLFRLSLPIMGTSFVQTAYSLTDMFWIGFLGSNSVAAVGLAGFYIWLAYALVMLSRTGTEINVAQATGAKNHDLAENYARTGIGLIVIIAIVYTFIMEIWAEPLILFFNTGDQLVERLGIDYLQIISFGLIFTFVNQVFTGSFNGRGDSKLPFILNTTGLVLNIIMDPILIFGIGVFPELGVIGAAVATVISQGIVFLLFVYFIKIKDQLFEGFKFFKRIKIKDVHTVLKMGFPPAIQSGLFTLISMAIARIVATYGPMPIAAQKVGSQIESITWMTVSGFSIALSSFIGQNYGAGKFDRIHKGYKSALKVALGIGVVNSLVLYFGASILFSIFIREPEVLPYGVGYLKILAFSQLFMSVEITMTGIFNGLGHTRPPAVIGVVFNLMRIPMALFLSKHTEIGLNGIWWSITISSIFKGLVSYVWLNLYIRRRPV